MGDEMRDLEERICRIEHSLYGIEMTRGICPNCNRFVPIMELTDHPENPTIRCLNCLQTLEHIDRYEIKK
ncbi:MAG: hypothetical protein KAV87_59065 [Desulfobacteraceae bacterium]|nr:hypothetical protein [Desulfobacteraceae bacterium]